MDDESEFKNAESPISSECVWGSGVRVTSATPLTNKITVPTQTALSFSTSENHVCLRLSAVWQLFKIVF